MFLTILLKLIRRCVTASVLAFALACSSAHAERAYVVGDSLGVGINWAAKQTSFARNSVALYNGWVLEQLQRVAEGSTVFMSLGTNDAVGGALNIDAPLQKILDVVDERKLRLVWIGPPCVFKPWNEFALKLDALLSQKLEGTNVTYVSMQNDPAICDRSLRAGDGVHFDMLGYTRMWRKAAAAIGFATIVATADELAAMNARHASTTHKKKRKRHPRSPAPTPTPTPAAPSQ